MANVRNGNTYYIDSVSTGGPPTTANNLNIRNIRLKAVALTATSANAILVLDDNQSALKRKIDLRVATAGETKYFDFVDNPMIFSNGLSIGTATNCVATLFVSEGNT